MSCMQKCKEKMAQKKAEEQPTVPIVKLLSYAKRNKIPLMIIGSIAAAANGAMLPGFSIVFGKLFDILLKQTGDELKDSLVKIAVSFVGLGVGNFIFAYLGLAFWGIVGEDVTRNLTSLLFASITKQEIAFFDKHSTGQLTNYLSSDLAIIGNGVGDKIGSFLIFFSQAMTGLIIAFVFGWKLTLVLIALSPAMIAASALQVKFVASGTQSQQGIKAKATTLATDTISGIKTVLSFVWEPEAVRRYNLLLKEFYFKGRRKSHLAGLGFGASFAMIFFVYALAFWYGGGLVADKEISVGDLLTVFFSIVISTMGLGQASQFNPDFAKARGSAYKILEIINRKTAIDVDAEGIKDVTLKGDITLNDVWFTYPVRKTEGEFSNSIYKEDKKEDKKEEKKEEKKETEELKNEPILKGLNLEVKKGQVVALVGSSGCGKSTTIALLERFYDIDKGSIQIDGKEIKDYHLGWLRSHIGLVSQEPILFNCSIADNIRWGKNDATMEEIMEAAKMANAHNFITEFDDGYDTQVGEKGGQMSGGQKQRIAIARAVLKNPSILLLDEATSALDTESEAIVQEALEKLMKNRTTLVIAHRLSTIKEADKIVVFKKGKAVEEGTHKELILQKGEYWKLVVRQMTEEEKEHYESQFSQVDINKTKKNESAFESETDEEPKKKPKKKKPSKISKNKKSSKTKYYPQEDDLDLVELEYVDD